MKPKCFVPDLKLFMHEQFKKFLDKDKNTFINMEISLCGICNANCDFCFYGSNKEKEWLHYAAVCDFIENAEEKTGLKAVTWTGGGEPTLNEYFLSITECIKQNTNVKQGLFTNALVIPEYDVSNFEWVRISKTDKEWNIDAINKIAIGCKKVGLCINFKDDSDLESIDDAIHIAEEHDSIEYIQVRPTLGIKGEASGVELTDALMEYNNKPKIFITDYKFEEANNHDRSYSKCYGYHFVPFLWHNGDFGCCGYQRDIIFGNIYKNTLEEIIGNIPEFINVRKNCQIACKNDMINKSINKVLKIEDADFV